MIKPFLFENRDLFGNPVITLFTNMRNYFKKYLWAFFATALQNWAFNKILCCDLSAPHQNKRMCDVLVISPIVPSGSVNTYKNSWAKQATSAVSKLISSFCSFFNKTWDFVIRYFTNMYMQGIVFSACNWFATINSFCNCKWLFSVLTKSSS